MDTLSYWYWSSTSYIYGAQFAWRVNFNYGGVNYDDKTDSYYVRAVRGEALKNSCPNDPNKIKLGVCGCGVSDIDNEPDGMIDCWEENYGLDTSVNDANEDFDEDGFINKIEYKRTTDPSNPNSHPSLAMPWIPLLLE